MKTAWGLPLLLLSGWASAAAVPQYSPLRDHRGAVASEAKECSSIGIELLKRGGNAADALAGTVFCVGVIGLHHSGIGGGGFMLVRDSDGSYEAIDFREKAPAAAFRDMYKHDRLASVFGGLAAGVPGEVRGLAYLHQNYGVLSWREVVNPAVKLARHGFVVTEDHIRYMTIAVRVAQRNFLVEDPSWAIDFAPNGELVKLGDILTRKRYADTLEKIAKYGPDVFYEGEMANATIAAIQAANGTMTTEDLKNYDISIRPAIEVDYRGYRLVSTGAPSSGAVALSVLKTLEGYESDYPAGLNLSTHHLDEAIRFAYGARMELGDPEYEDGVDDFEAEMLTESKAALIRSKISDYHTLNVTAYDPTNHTSARHAGTSHIVTADMSGMSISLTTTINTLFGSLVIVPETGIIMNNEMDDFSIPGVPNFFGFVPSPINYIAPGKRPLSSITPVIVEYPNGELYISTGAAGGSQIPTATILSLWHVLDHNMSMAEALAEPRIHDQLMPNIAIFEDGYDQEIVDFMVGRGHNVTWVPLAGSATQGLRRLPNGTFEAGGEPRQKNSGGFAW